MIDGRYIKDPEAVLDWLFDWAAETNGHAVAGEEDWLDLSSSEVITSYTVTATSGLTIDSDTLAYDDTVVRVWLSGGEAGEDYEVTCHIETSEGREDDRTIEVRVRER